jgi:hypothetical protein
VERREEMVRRRVDGFFMAVRRRVSVWLLLLTGGSSACLVVCDLEKREGG